MGDLDQEVLDALERGPVGGLTAPQVHSVVPGSYEEVKAALGRLEEEGQVSQVVDADDEEAYPIYRLQAGRG